jgi:hypothetical protein
LRSRNAARAVRSSAAFARDIVDAVDVKLAAAQALQILVICLSSASDSPVLCEQFANKVD